MSESLNNLDENIPSIIKNKLSDMKYTVDSIDSRIEQFKKLLLQYNKTFIAHEKLKRVFNLKFHFNMYFLYFLEFSRNF